MLIQRQLPSAGELTPIHQDRPVNSDLLRAALDQIAVAEDLVILGCGCQFLFRNRPSVFHAQIVASLLYRVARVMRLAGVDKTEAERIIKREDRAKFELVHTIYGANWRDPVYYDLVLNAENIPTEQAAQLIVQGAGARGIQPRALGSDSHRRPFEPRLDLAGEIPGEAAVSPHPVFAHASEREFARVMDFYQVRWQYEPRTFPVNWNTEGVVTEAFTPDFYLPDLDLYIELTTMRQSLVTRKNRKIRKLRKLYPDIHIKILYERDYRSLIQKYGLAEPTNA